MIYIDNMSYVEDGAAPELSDNDDLWNEILAANQAQKPVNFSSVRQPAMTISISYQTR